ncbi:MAG: orotidine-5'-phosphate decarboxylase [Succinivibrionaceae bacterium]|nr:orotidine-5'-phosphate decarboxylase [Succinivibrionaceae bacterium]
MSLQSAGIVVAMDFQDEGQALDFAAKADPALCRLKIGKEMFTRFGPSLVRRLMASGYDVFLDLKFHDIPNTVAMAVKAAADLGVWMVNVHAFGGRKMMEAAAEILVPYGKDAPILTAVTVLTSMDQEQLRDIGIAVAPREQVSRLAALAAECGIRGVVCSAQEAGMLRDQRGEDFLLVTPGIRPRGADAGDQSRIVTPEQAVAFGANYLVIGRPITRAEDPLAALKAIDASIRTC